MRISQIIKLLEKEQKKEGDIEAYKGDMEGTTEDDFKVVKEGKRTFLHIGEW